LSYSPPGLVIGYQEGGERKKCTLCENRQRIRAVDGDIRLAGIPVYGIR